MNLYRIFFCLVPMFFAGCGLMPRTGEPSLALQIADEMGLPASDTSREDYNKLLKQSGGTSVNYDGIMTGALALDPAMMILGSLSNPSPASQIQVVAWVPASRVSSAEDAVALTEQIARDVVFESSADKKKVQALKRIDWAPNAIGLPYGDVGFKTYTQLYQITVGYTPDLQPAPLFMDTSELVYGPLLLGNPFVDGTPQDIAKKLPEWFYIYDPGLYKERPRAIYNAQSTYLFIEPEK